MAINSIQMYFLPMHTESVPFRMLPLKSHVGDRLKMKSDRIAEKLYATCALTDNDYEEILGPS